MAESTPAAMSALTIPDTTGLDPLAAAYAYAKAGWYVGPVAHGTKHPGSVLGKGWQFKTTRDPEAIADTWMMTDHGIFLHVGRSGAFVIDVDTPTSLPDVLADALTSTPAPFQYTRRNDLARRHYVYRQPEGRTFGNGLGNLPTGWGDVRGANGVIVVAPSKHPSEDGHYAWGRTGEVPELPATIATLLTDTTTPVDVATDSAIRAFFNDHTEGSEQAQADAWVRTFERFVREGDSRHQRALSILTGALKEATAGYFPAAYLEERLRAAFLNAVTQPGHGQQGKARTPAGAVEEWRGILAWAVAQANTADRESVVARAETHSPTRALDDYVTGDTNTNATKGEDDDEPEPEFDPETGEILDPTPAPEPQASPLDALLDPGTSTEEPAPSWEPINLTPYLDGTYTPAVPRILTRTDGPNLIYPGKVHSIYGESESGKSWVAQYATTTELQNGNTVLYVDFESDAPDVLQRLTALGATHDHLLGGHFAYTRPEAPARSFGEAEAFQRLLAHPWNLVVLDGVTEALGIEGKSSLDNDEITAWMRAIPRRIARETGAAVILIDHVVKSAEGRGRFPIGGQAKMAAIDGAAFLVEPVSALGQGLDGALTIRVTKDRPGAVRAAAGDWRKSDRTQEAARLRLDSTEDTMQVFLQPPQRTDIPVDENGNFMPTRVMENISRVLNTMTEPISLTGLKATLRERGLGARDETVGRSVKILIERGFVVEMGGNGKSAGLRAASVYDARNDPESPDYTGGLGKFSTLTE